MTLVESECRQPWGFTTLLGDDMAVAGEGEQFRLGADCFRRLAVANREVRFAHQSVRIFPYAEPQNDRGRLSIQFHPVRFRIPNNQSHTLRGLT